MCQHNIWHFPFFGVHHAHLRMPACPPSPPHMLHAGFLLPDRKVELRKSDGNQWLTKATVMPCKQEFFLRLPLTMQTVTGTSPYALQIKFLTEFLCISSASSRIIGKISFPRDFHVAHKHWIVSTISFWEDVKENSGRDLRGVALHAVFWY